MMPWEDASVQLIDTPPVSDSHIEPYLTSMVRSADAVVLAMDGSSDDAPDETANVIDQLRSRKTLLAAETGFGEDDFSIVQIKTLLVVTRGDHPGCGDRLDYFREMIPTPFLTLTVELDQADAVNALRNHIYRLLDIIRVYTKRPGKPAD